MNEPASGRTPNSRVAEDSKVGLTGGCFQSVAEVGVVSPTKFDQHILAEAIDLTVIVTLRRAASIGVGDRGIPRSLPRECLGTEAVPMPPFHPSARQQLDQVAVSPSLQQAGQTDRRPADMTAGWLVDPYAPDQ